MRVLGIAGTAKNTGKTTATVALISQWPRPETLAVTSIGYDGESRDNVTGLPKPRLDLPVGTLVATARRCLDAGSARLKIIEETPYDTPLGPLAVARVEEGGLVVMAGPSHQQVLRKFLKRFRELGAEMVLVDGAFSRMSPMAVVDGLVLATGGARSQDIGRIARETKAIEEILALPLAEAGLQPAWKLSNLLVTSQVEGIDVPPEARELEILGVIDNQPLAALLDKAQGLGTLIFADPVKVLLVSDLLEAAQTLKAFRGRGGKVYVRSSLTLLGIIINPFYPAYNEANREFSPAWLDAERLRREVAAATAAPVIDVIKDGPECVKVFW